MNRTAIEWTDYTVNPVKGLCPMACPYCYARRMYKRYKWDETIRFDPEVLISNKAFEAYRSHPRVFVGSTFELFGPWVDEDWLHEIFSLIENIPATFIFLTKQPQNLAKWSPFPKNCWVGVSITDGDKEPPPLMYLKDIKAAVKFVSFEPLLHWWDSATSEMTARSFKTAGVNWVIIGQQTPVSKKTQPKIEWVREIVDAADKAKIPVFLKNNLYDLLPFLADYQLEDTFWMDTSHLRQELPEALL